MRSKQHVSYEDSYGLKKNDSSEINYSSHLQPYQIQNDFQGNFLENATIPVHEVPFVEEPNLLQQYKDSGLSSSTYELSQYISDSSNHYEAAPSKDWSPIQGAEDSLAAVHPVAPQKFSLPHVPVCFGAGGQLIRGCPNYPAEGQPALVEIHSLEVILHDTPEQEAMRAFPGPLIREDLHKMDVMTFCQRRAAPGWNLASNLGRDSALLWKLLLLLCRQNGSMVGSDIAELLMQDCKHRERYKRQEPVANLINLTDEEWSVQGCGATDLLTGEIIPSAGTPQQKVEKFTQLLYYGRKKEALDWAMRNQLWGHALFLSSKMDLRTYSWVLSGFTSTLAFNDPLQTLFQLMSGRIPQASQCCGDEKWGDWRLHLAVILSNQVGGKELNPRAIVTMGDTLAAKGSIEAAHFCYLMANVPFGHYGIKTDRMVLLGSSQSQSFSHFARTECIQRTEIFEYCQLLQCPKAFIPSFQVYKLIYASYLVDYGLTAQALHYCEGVGMALLTQSQNMYPVLLEQVIKLAERLKLSDPRLLERPEQEVTLEPDWLMELRDRHRQWEEEGGLLGATSIQPEFPGISGPIPGLAPCSELAQSQGCMADLDHQASSPLSPGASAQCHEPSMDQELYLHPRPGLPLDTTDADLEIHLPGIGQASILSLGGPPDELSSCLHQPPGDTVESSGPYHFPGDQKNFLEHHQKTINARTRSVSESSTISITEDTSQSLEEGTEEGVASEKPPVEEAEQDQAQASSSGWFSWFRSKPNKDANSSKKVPASLLNSTVPVSQEKGAPPPSLPPIDVMKSSSLPPPRFSHLPHTDGNPFSKRSLGTRNPLGFSSREETIFPNAGDQASFVTSPRRGTVPHFIPTKVTTPGASGTGHQQ
ncbi:protein transport protein Sec16B [Sceloporus undulatus]|uniref:protein transport protein Sec16B n=1 Tax=Sceloporus undulatus TaxID=8520 RepID=UPI001C4D8CC6|nr:protein transport protein Sec16B [Sceloporus undulatus]